MKSGKQRRIELKAKKQSRKDRLSAKQLALTESQELPPFKLAVLQGGLLVDTTALAPNNSYSVPDFVQRQYYIAQPFTCAGCNIFEVWTAAQQKWWYEEAKGSLFTTAKFCRTCRRQEQERRTIARRIHNEGIAKKCHSSEK